MNDRTKYFLSPLVLLIFFGSIPALILLLGCNQIGSSKKYTIIIDDSYVGGISASKKHKIIKKIDEAIYDVTQYLDTSYSDTLHVYIFSTRGSGAGNNIIYFNIDDLEHDYNIVHETTHAVLGVNRTRFENEGLAVLMENKFMTDDTNYQKVIWRYLESFSRNDYSISSLDYMIKNQSNFFLDTALIKFAYAQAGLFYLFLDDYYGKKKLKEFYVQGFGKIESVYGVSVDSLDALWRKWMFKEKDLDHYRSESKEAPVLVGKSGNEKKSFLNYQKDSNSH